MVQYRTSNPVHNEAHGYLNAVIPEVRGKVEMVLRDAEAHREEKTRHAQGKARRFLQTLEPYQQAKAITRKRLVVETREEGPPQIDKVSVEDGAASHLLPILPVGKWESWPKANNVGQER